MDPATVPASETNVPSGTGTGLPANVLTIANSGLNTCNTFYWGRRAMADIGNGTPSSASDYAAADVTHWAQGMENNTGSIAVPLSTKKRLEGRVWYNYPNQSADGTQVELQSRYDNPSSSPSVVARYISATDTQLTQATYDVYGHLIVSVDASPNRRTTMYTYDDDNGIDLLHVSQVDGSSTDVLSTMHYTDSFGNNYHVPVTVTDASGQITRMSYNGQGQLHTRTVVVGGQDQTTTLAYYPSGYLSSVTGPITGATTSYTYDSAGRVQTVTDSEGYVLTTAYDNLDRPVTTTYPDGTTDTTTYDKLDVSQQKDRQNRVTKNQYDLIRELLQTTDPLGRTTKYAWCTCGGLTKLTDANGNATTWGLDGEGRVTSKTYADASSISYTYEANSGRLQQMTDAVGNLAVYTYNDDNTLANTVYTPASGVAATHGVSFHYDTAYNRVLTMADGVGTTTYHYKTIDGSTTLGQGRLDTVTVPLATTTPATPRSTMAMTSWAGSSAAPSTAAATASPPPSILCAASPA